MADLPVTDRCAFAQAWPGVAKAVELALRRRGLGREAAQDVVQETALRALARLSAGQGYTSELGLQMWAHRVARNLATSTWRKDRHVVYMAVETPVDDVADTVLLRERLAAVRAALPRLTPGQRRALLDETADAPGHKREAMRRKRARDQLYRLLPGAWPLRRLRRLVLLGGTAAVGSLVGCGLLLVPQGGSGTTVLTVARAALGTPEATVAAPSAPLRPALPATAVPSATGRRGGPGAAARPYRPVVQLAAPTTDVDVGTRPDAGAFVCVATELAGPRCVPKARHLAAELLEGRP